jgi:hypothetical protein
MGKKEFLRDANDMTFGKGGFSLFHDRIRIFWQHFTPNSIGVRYLTKGAG